MADPYKAALVNVSNYVQKREVLGNLVVVLKGKLEDRGLNLIAPVSRAVQKHEIHELIGTDELEAAPGSRVGKIAYLGFMEVVQGGMVITGDEVTCGNRLLGKIAGFDETHLPNHLNIVIHVGARQDGTELGLALESEVKIRKT
jgi:hypothetical protein